MLKPLKSYILFFICIYSHYRVFTWLMSALNMIGVLRHVCLHQTNNLIYPRLFETGDLNVVEYELCAFNELRSVCNLASKITKI